MTLNGWIAHAMEEYGEQALRWRANELYVGPAPRPVPERPASLSTVATPDPEVDEPGPSA